MTFRLTTLLYLFALVASSMSVLGAWGVLVGLIVFYLWLVQHRDPEGFRQGALLVLLPLLVLGLPLLIASAALYDTLPSWSRTPSIRNMSLNNLKQLTLAIHNYHSLNGHYPPPYAADDAGQPLYSWRALILPCIEGNNFHKLFRYDEPWDSPRNAQLLQYEIEEFVSPRLTPPYSRDEPDIAETHYFAIVGGGTIWDPNKKVTESDVTDGLDQTMLLIEVQGTGIKWSEPRDFTLEEAIALLEGPGEEWIAPGYFVSYRYDRAPQSYRCVAFADGHADAVYSGNDPADLRAMLTRAGGEPPRELIDWRTAEQKYLGLIVHWGRIWGLALWGAIITLPASRRLAIFPATPTHLRRPSQKE